MKTEHIIAGALLAGAAYLIWTMSQIESKSNASGWASWYDCDKDGQVDTMCRGHVSRVNCCSPRSTVQKVTF